MSDIHLSSKQKETLKNALRNAPHLSDTRLSKDFGVSTTCVWYHRGRLGLESARYYRDKKIRQAWRDNPVESTIFIAELCDVSPAKAWNVKKAMWG